MSDRPLLVLDLQIVLPRRGIYNVRPGETVQHAALRIARDGSVVDHLTGCWIWGGLVNRRGYSKITIGGYASTLGRHILGLVKGDSLVMRHHCDVPRCVNPDHLARGTTLENSQDCVERGRQWNSNKTHCPKGHPYNDGNVVLEKNGPGSVSRKCRICLRANSRAWYADPEKRARNFANRRAARAVRRGVERAV